MNDFFQPYNLNKNKIPKIGQRIGLPLTNTDTTSETGNISVHFRDLDQKLAQYISQAEAVVGAVAWLTHEHILEELAKKKLVAIVVQKDSFSEKTKNLYEKLPPFKWQAMFTGIIDNISSYDDSHKNWKAIRCVGTYKKSTRPLMHNKFLIFCTIQYMDFIDDTLMASGIKESLCYVEVPFLYPYAVWTGSFNISKNAVNSLENALYITDPKIVNAYYDEWCQIQALSEELNWKNDCMTPQWRIED
jgi:hypothetical protein